MCLLENKFLRFSKQFFVTSVLFLLLNPGQSVASEGFSDFNSENVSITGSRLFSLPTEGSDKILNKPYASTLLAANFGTDKEESKPDVWKDEGDKFTYSYNYLNPGFARQSQNNSYDDLVGDTGAILVMGVGVLGFLYVMPESFSQWDDDQKDMNPTATRDRYKRNVSGGPVWDKDDWTINYIGHPYFGAAYYTHARRKGYSRWDSLSYSIMMSTAFYEYGIEALFEEPSIQDLFCTPFIGSAIGELFMNAEESIKNNGDTLMGSKILGGICLMLIDPIGYTVKPLNDINKRWTKFEIDTEYYARHYRGVDDGPNLEQYNDFRAGFLIHVYRRK